MSGTTIRVGIIGCGQIAQSHLATYQKVPGVQVVALCDIDPAPLKKTGEAFGVAPADRYLKYTDLLARQDIDAVDVCLHNNLHMPATVESLKAGKHTYCEKPMAGSYQDAATMLETARKLGRKLHIQLSTLYAPATRAAKELIAAGELGEIYHARSTGHRRRGRPYVDGYGSENFVKKDVAAGGALYDMGVYHIAQMLYLMGNPTLERVSGRTYQKIEMDPARREKSGYSVEELGTGYATFAGGLTMDIIEAWAIHLDSLEGSSIVGSRGGVRLNPFGFFHSAGDLDLDCTAFLDAAKSRWADVRCDGGVYLSSQHHWIAALQGKVELLPTAEIALNTMLISEGIFLSTSLKREVTASEIRSKSVSTAVSLLPQEASMPLEAVISVPKINRTPARARSLA